MCISMLPPAILRGNGRGGWRVKAAWARKWRESAFSHALADTGFCIGDTPMQRAEIQYIFYSMRAAQADDENFRIGMKSWVDGLRDAGMLAGDTSAQVTELKPRFERCQRGDEKTIVEVTEI